MTLVRTYLALVLAALLWGANFNLAKYVLVEMAPFAAGAWRYLIAAAVALTVLLCSGGRLAFRHIRAYALLATFGVFGFSLFFNLALRSTSAVNASLIMALSPLLTVIVAYFVIGDRPTVRQIVLAPVGTLGVAIVVLGGSVHHGLTHGDALMFVASLMWSLYSVYVRKSMPGDTSSTANIAGIMLLGAAALTLVSFASGDGLPIPSPRAGAALLVQGLGGSLVAYFLWNAGVARLGAGPASLFINLVPVASMLISTALGTPPSPAQLLGGAIVIGAVGLSTSAVKRAPGSGR